MLNECETSYWREDYLHNSTTDSVSVLGYWWRPSTAFYFQLCFYFMLFYYNVMLRTIPSHLWFHAIIGNIYYFSNRFIVFDLSSKTAQGYMLTRQHGESFPKRPSSQWCKRCPAPTCTASGRHSPNTENWNKELRGVHTQKFARLFQASALQHALGLQTRLD